MESEIVPRYSFVPLLEKKDSELNSSNVRNLLEKWGINLQVQYFTFNEPFQQYHKHDLAEAFFKDPVVARNLKIWNGESFTAAGIIASKIDVQQIPCAVMCMSFFNKMKDPNNNIVYDPDNIRQRFHEEIRGIFVSDHLRGMLIDENSNEFNLYSKDERNEFIFRLFQLLVLGGEYCQYEDNLTPYLDTTKTLYKTFCRIRKNQDQDSNPFISTTVLEVTARADSPYFPKNPDHIQNVGFLFIDGHSRQITTLLHQFSAY